MHTVCLETVRASVSVATPDVTMGWVEVPTHVTYPIMHLMLSTYTPREPTDAMRKHYLPATSFAGGNNCNVT